MTSFRRRPPPPQQFFYLLICVFVCVWKFRNFAWFPGNEPKNYHTMPAHLGPWRVYYISRTREDGNWLSHRTHKESQIKSSNFETTHKRQTRISSFAKNSPPFLSQPASQLSRDMHPVCSGQTSKRQATHAFCVLHSNFFFFLSRGPAPNQPPSPTQHVTVRTPLLRTRALPDSKCSNQQPLKTGSPWGPTHDSGDAGKTPYYYQLRHSAL